MRWNAEERYILKRKVKAFGNSLCFYLCRIFPIDHNLISVCTFEGKGGFGCNPKYIIQELHKQIPGCKIVWFVNKDIIAEKKFPAYVKVVPNTLWNRAYWLSRSRVWIDNYRKPYGTIKRKGQYYLNTNHYTLGIKTVGLWRGAGFSKMAYLVSKNDSDMIDDLIIDSKFCEEVTEKGLLYEGHLLKTGAPRCDVLFGDRSDWKRKLREKHGLAEYAKIVLFAPTFREGAKDGKRSVYSEIWTIDFQRLLHNLEVRFGGDWFLCVRVHPQLAPTFADYENPVLKGKIINESQADDLYEIMAGVDAYITDYSSACFEAGFAKIPVFLYADDIEKYEKDRGSLYWDLSWNERQEFPINKKICKNLDVNLPFSLARNNEELEDNIRTFEQTKYEMKLDVFHQVLQLQFDGKASKEIVDILREQLNRSK